MTNVPSFTFGIKGFVAPAEGAVLQGMQDDMNAAFGGNLNPALSTPQGQLVTSFTAIKADADSQLLALASQVDPLYAQGRMQDAIAYIYFLDRDPATSTTVTCTCTGLANVVIPANAQAIDTSGNVYLAVAGGMIPLSGTIDLVFAAQNPGPLACPAHTLTRVYGTIPGWDTIDNTLGVAIGDTNCGRDVESQQAFEYRRAQSVAMNGMGSLPSIYGAVFGCYPPGDFSNRPTDFYATENHTGSNKMIGGVTLTKNSLYICAAGGDDTTIANTIWTKKMPGCDYSSGNLFTGDTTSLTLSVDSMTSGFIAVGQTLLGLEIPTSASFNGSIDLIESSPVTVSYVSSGPAITDGSIVVSATITDLPVIDAQISGVPGGVGIYSLSTLEGTIDTELMTSYPSLGCTASINTLSMIVSATDGVIIPYTSGDAFYPAISGAGVPDFTGGSKIWITAQESGATGGIGTYSLSSTGGTVGSESMRVQTGIPTNFYGNTLIEYDSVLTADATVTGSINAGQTLTGSGVPGSIKIISQLTGSVPGKDGTYLLTAGAGTLTTEAMSTAGLDYPTGITIAAFGSGSGGVGDYTLSEDVGTSSPDLSLTSGTVIQVPDKSYQVPYPTYDVMFTRPIDVPIYFTVLISDNAGLPATIEADVKAAILNAWTGGDGGVPARIGSGIHASRFYPPVTAISIYCHIVTILLGTSPSPGDTDIQMDIDQRPTLVAGNIVVGLV